MVFYSFRGVVQKVTMTGRLTEVFCRPLERLVTGLLNVPPPLTDSHIFSTHPVPIPRILHSQYFILYNKKKVQSQAKLLSSSGDLEPSIRV